MTIYSNPRTEAIVENWRIGRSRCTATFTIERHPERGERAVRQTVGKPKKLTYARKVRIVDGDDGRTYIAYFLEHAVSVFRGTMDFQHEVVWEAEPRFAEMRALFEGDEK